MDNLNLTPIFKNISLKQAYRGDFAILYKEGIPLEELQKFREICEMGDMSIRKAYDFLSVADPLFTYIYGEGNYEDGERVFYYPFAKGVTIPEGTKMVRGPLGTQTSKWHHESLSQHVALVAANLVDAGIRPQMAVALAVLHDVGKKYTTSTNKRGEISFYGHAKVGAFIAAHWLARWLRPMDWRMAHTIVAVIYAHMDAHELWALTEDPRTHAPVDYRSDFRKELLGFCEGDEEWTEGIMNLIDVFQECDEGVAAVTPEIEQKIKRGEELILNTVVCS